MSVLGIFFGDNLLDLQPQRAEELLFGEGPYQFARAVDGALAFSSGDADVGHLRLTRAVDDAAHNRNLHRRGVLLGDRLYAAPQFEHADLRAAARGARGDLEALLAQAERLEDRPADRNLFDRIGC